jgi:hypothetical protein
MNYVRKSGYHVQDYSAAGWRLSKPEDAELIELYERLPKAKKKGIYLN